MTRKILILAVVLAAGLCGGRAALAEDRPGTGMDRATYNRLTDQVRDVDQEFAQAMQDAMREAREGDGKASLETQSRVLGLREKRDRLMTRITLVALRHGWKLPDQNPDGTVKPGQGSSTDKFFEPASDMIRNRFAAESKRIAAAVSLPVVSIEVATGKGDE